MNPRFANDAATEKALAALPAGGGGPDGLEAKVVDVIQADQSTGSMGKVRLGLGRVARPLVHLIQLYHIHEHTRGLSFRVSEATRRPDPRCPGRTRTRSTGC